MMDGWPIAHHVFACNRLDQTTVGEVVEDLRQRFGLQRVVFVGDRGLVTPSNLEPLRQAQQGYLVGLQRRNRKEIPPYIEQAVVRDKWQECPVGITAAEKAMAPQTRVQEVPGKEPGVRVFVVQSQEREEYERSWRELSMQRTRKELEALRLRVVRPMAMAVRFSAATGGGGDGTGAQIAQMSDLAADVGSLLFQLGKGIWHGKPPRFMSRTPP